MKKKHIFLIALLFVQVVFAQTVDELFNQKFKEIIVDVRGSRGGNGDVGAGYLTVMDLIQNYQIKGSITVLVDSTSKKILDRLAQGNEKFWSRVNIESIESIPSGKVYDLYLVLANPSGSFRYKGNLTETSSIEGFQEQVVHSENRLRIDYNNVNRTNENRSHRFDQYFADSDYYYNKKITVRSEGVLIVQTVLGNTENYSSVNPLAVVRSHGINYDMSPAGIAANESGVYNDYVATELRPQTARQVRDFIVKESRMIEDSFSQQSVQKIISGQKLKGAKVGLVYGITAWEPKTQFMSYLKGLTQEPKGSFCIITPSKLRAEDIQDPILKEKIKFITSVEEMPHVAEEGKIYVVETKTLPHKVFIGLVAYSMKAGLVPIGAGDGFTSAVVNLGGPFALTRVAWNAKNIENIKQRLFQIDRASNPKLADTKNIELLLKEVFENIDLTRAQSLHRLAPLFSDLSNVIPQISERLMNAAVMATSRPDDSVDRASYYDKVSDPVLKASLIAGGIAGQIKSTQDFLDEAQEYCGFSGCGYYDDYMFTDSRFRNEFSRRIYQNSKWAYADQILDRLALREFVFTPAANQQKTKKSEIPRSVEEFMIRFEQHLKEKKIKNNSIQSSSTEKKVDGSKLKCSAIFSK